MNQEVVVPDVISHSLHKIELERSNSENGFYWASQTVTVYPLRPDEKKDSLDLKQEKDALLEQLLVGYVPDSINIQNQGRDYIFVGFYDRFGAFQPYRSKSSGEALRIHSLPAINQSRTEHFKPDFLTYAINRSTLGFNDDYRFAIFAHPLSSTYEGIFYMMRTDISELDTVMPPMMKQKLMLSLERPHEFLIRSMYSQ
jgi:hypothetical protein